MSIQKHIEEHLHLGYPVFFEGREAFCSYKGTWDASTGVYPTDAICGNYYVVNVEGTIEGTLYHVGDWMVYGDGVWQKVDNFIMVSSVNGMVGTVVLDPDDLNDTATTNKFVTLAQRNQIHSQNTDTAINASVGSGIVITTAGTLSAVTNTLHSQGTDSSVNSSLSGILVATTGTLSAVTNTLHSQNTDVGTTSATFYLNTTGVKIKDVAGNLEVRNNADNAYASITALAGTFGGAFTQSAGNVIFNNTNGNYDINIKQYTSGDAFIFDAYESTTGSSLFRCNKMIWLPQSVDAQSSPGINFGRNSPGWSAQYSAELVLQSTTNKTFYISCNGGASVGGANPTSCRMRLESDETIWFYNSGNKICEVNTAFEMVDGKNIKLGTTTGTSIGITTSAKLAFWGGTPGVQPTTATYGVWTTLANVVSALQARGILGT